MQNIPKEFVDGHFYSPIVNVGQATTDQHRIWTEYPKILGIDFNDEKQKYLISEIFPTLLRDYNYPDQKSDEFTFYNSNSQYSWMDSRSLFCLLRYLSPKRMIEIGSGFSSLLVADVNRRFLKNTLQFTCIEPHPREFLVKGVPGITQLISRRVEEVPISTFTELQSGDILFIDSSHVSKTGSDVNYIYFEILPRLASGVHIHIHDIFFPRDYPKEWVLKKGRSWNEQYILQALLMYSAAFEVTFGSAYVFYQYPDLVKRLLNGNYFGGGSFWIQKRQIPSR